MSRRMGITVSDETYSELIEEASREGITLAILMRRILDGHFRRSGKVINTTVEWGGDREGSGSKSNKRNGAGEGE